MAFGPAEAGGHESLYEFPGECGPDNFSTQTNDIHVVIFDALTGGEDIMDERGAHAWNLVRRDGRSYSAAAERQSAFNLPCCDSPGQWDDEVGVVISGVEVVRLPNIDHLMPGGPKGRSHLHLEGANPPWSAAIPTRIMVSP